MKFRLAALFAGVTLAALCLAVGPVSGQGKKIEPIKTWKGSHDEENLMMAAPRDHVIADEKTFRAIWDAWKLGDKAPEIDFKKELVIVGVTRGSRLNVGATLGDDGNLQVVAISTRDLRPGFRYEMHQISRDGVKTVNGKDLK